MAIITHYLNVEEVLAGFGPESVDGFVEFEKGLTEAQSIIISLWLDAAYVQGRQHANLQMKKNVEEKLSQIGFVFPEVA